MPKSTVSSEVEVALEWIAKQQAQERPAEHSSYSPARLYHPRHWVRTASAADVLQRDVWMGRRALCLR